MTLKNEITNKVAQILNLDLDKKSVKKLIHSWWENPRNKSQGGLRLTDIGFEALRNADIKFHKVKLEHPIKLYTNQLVIYLDRYIDCPWFINKTEIFVFGDKMAVQLILFEGNLERFLEAKVLNLKSS